MALRSANSIVADASEKIIETLTPQLRNMAHDAGWPPEIIEQMSLENVSGRIVITFPKEAEELEYGSIGTSGIPHRSVIRTFGLRYETEAYKFLYELIGEDFYYNGGGW